MRLCFRHAVGLEKEMYNPNRAVFDTESKGMQNNCYSFDSNIVFSALYNVRVMVR